MLDAEIAALLLRSDALFVRNALICVMLGSRLARLLRRQRRVSASFSHASRVHLFRCSERGQAGAEEGLVSVADIGRLERQANGMRWRVEATQYWFLV